jgi:hypothetical protein
VYNDGSTLPVYYALVTAVAAGVNGAITLSGTSKCGTAPTSSATARTIKVGGAWKGPNGTDGTPWTLLTNVLTSAAGDAPRVNMKNSAAYAITAAVTQPTSGSTGILAIQGYASTPGDGGRFVLDGGTAGASYVLLALNQWTILEDAEFRNNGATGTSTGVTAGNGVLRRCVFHDLRGCGVQVNASLAAMIECEAYNCNQSNTTQAGGIRFDNSIRALRCVAHNNAGSNNCGFVLESGYLHSLFGCVAASNGADGLRTDNSPSLELVGCDFYGNGGSGVRNMDTSMSLCHLESCNFVGNAAWGFNGAGTGYRAGYIINCGFGSGTAANASGTTTGLEAIVETGSLTYPANATPWVSPATGNFGINLPAAQGAGRGAFTLTQAGYGPTTGYPDVGAAQHAGGGGGGNSVIGSGIVLGMRGDT